MKQISRKDWENYIKALSGLSQKAAQIMQAFAEQNGLEDRDALIRMQYALATKYGEAAASLACQMHDAVAEASGAMVPPAEPAETATYKEAAIAVNGSLKQSPSGKVLPQTTDRLVKQAAADTTLKNALRDGAQFAWVPNGDTCAFCLTLASRGWQYASKKTIQGGHADHIHANCDCTFAIRFDNNTTVEGYNPDKYKRIYSGAKGNTPQEKINVIRKALDAKKREENTIKLLQEKYSVLKEYNTMATPGIGKIVHDSDYLKDKQHRDDIATGNWIIDIFGGDIRLLTERERRGQKVETVDGWWRGAYIEFKKPTSVNAVRKRIRKGTSQLIAMGKSDFGRLLIDISGREVDQIEMIKAILDEAPKRNKQKTLDIIVRENNKVVDVYRIIK